MKNKRFLSMLLALSLLLSLLPAGPVLATSNASDGYEYVFTAEAQGKAGPVTSGFSDTYTNINGDISDKWAKSARYYPIKDCLQLKKDVATHGGLAFPFGTERLTTGEFCAGVKINVENGGSYKPELKYFASKAAPIVDIYLIKAGTISNGQSTEVALKASSNDAKVGVYNYLKALPDTYIVANDVNMWNDGKLEKTYDFDGGVWTLEAGDYYLYFRAVGKDDNFTAADLNTEYGGATRAIAVLALNSFKLTPKVEAPTDELEGFSLAPKDGKLQMGNSLSLTATAEYSVSGKKILTEGVTYESSAKGVAEVSQNGVVTGISEGTARITATVDGTTLSDFVDITVEPKKRATKEYNYVFSKRALGSGDRVLTGALGTKTYDDIDAAVSHKWQPASRYYLYNVYADDVTDLLARSALVDENNAEFGYACFGVKLHVEEGGTYLPSLTYTARVSAPIFDVYLVKEGTQAGGLTTADLTFNAEEANLTFIKNLDDTYKIGTIDMWAASGQSAKVTENFDNMELSLDEDSDYYLLFRAVGKNEGFTAYSSNYFYASLYSFMIKPPVGDFDRAEIVVGDLPDESAPMPVMTENQIEFKLYDDIGLSIDNIDESKLSATYSSSDKSVATVSEEGLVTAHSNGETKITADITYDGILRSATYNLTVATCGRNMMENLNPDFENDEWVWSSTRNDVAPETPIFFRTGIEVEPKDGDEDNRALTFTFNPDIPQPSSVIATITLKTDGKRIKVEPNKIYQLRFKAKTNVKQPEGGEIPTIRYSVYAYNNPSGTSGSALEYVSGIDTDLNSFENWQEAFSEWQEVVVPISISATSNADELYLTPRLNIRTELSGKAGYSGKIWMDDFELREVGFAGIEMEVTGDTTYDGGGTFNVLTKPYTTLGDYISIDNASLRNAFEIEASDENVVSDFRKSTLHTLSGGTKAASTTALAGGKNGTAKIYGELTINGITRKGEVSVTTSGYPMKLLYASAETMPASVEVGASAQLVPTGFMSDGSVADMTDGRIIYESLTPDIVSVDENGVITTLRAGKGRFAATLILNGNSAYCETEIEVTDSSAIVSASLSGPETVGYLRDEPLILTGKMASGYDADFTHANIKWLIGSDIENGVKVIDGNLVFGNIKGAIATISAEIELGGGKVKTNEIEVEVVESDLRDFIIDFRGVKEKTVQDVTFDKYGWQLDNNLSDASVGSSYLYNDHLYITTTGVEKDFVIDFNAPYTGNYTPVFKRGYSNGSGAEYVYIYIDGKYAGDISFCSTNLRGIDDIVNLRSVYLEAGPHKLVLRPYSKNGVSSNYYMYPAYVRFAAITELPQISKIITAKDSFEIRKGANAELLTRIEMGDGFIFDGKPDYSGAADTSITVSYNAPEPLIADVSSGGTITANDVGVTTITVSADCGGVVKTKEITVTVVPEGAITADEALDSVEIDAPYFVMNPENEGVQLKAVGRNFNNEELDLTGAEIVWTIDGDTVAEISDSGYVTPVGLGSAKITVTVTLAGITKTCETFVSVREGKVGRTYFTEDMVAAAQENVQKYSWAKAEAKAVIATADTYLGLEDTLWEMVPGEGLPRGISTGYRTDPDRSCCRYCGTNLPQNYGGYAWRSNPLTRPWKIQCPHCKRLFPSNDFASFYELGRDEHGIFNRELALERHQEKFGGTYGTGYLKNELYPEIGSESCPVKLTGNETTEKWGVDDGFGYDTGRVYPNGTKEVHTYIAYYMHWGLWYPSGSGNPGTIRKALDSLAQAYMYTGDEKYGRVGAILLDRVADVYPGYDLRPYLLRFSNSDGGSVAGKIVGRIWEVDVANTFSEAYDAFFPMYDDPYVVSFLNEKAKKYNNTEKNDKSTSEKVRKNIEDGILREIYREVERSSIGGNFGAHQATLARAAIVLDSHPETEEMFNWIFKSGETDSNSYNHGGNVSERLINDVSRDGQGSESGPGYNRGWVTDLSSIANTLAGYDEYEGVDLFENPKYIEMIKSFAPLTVVRRGLGPIGDSGTFGMLSLLPDEDSVLIKAFKETKDIEIAQHLYFIKGGNLDNIHYDIFTKDPERLTDEIEEIIDTYGEYNYDESSMLTGYGFGALRDGTLHKSGGTDTIKDTQRDFWMYFGGAKSHSHRDKLALGIDAYGIPLTSDLGYPEATGSDLNRYQWQSATLSHNTVVVNEQNQDTGTYSATPLHFDTKDTRVKVMDVDASVVYASASEYRRTVVMVDYDDEISYGIDFFKVLGGNDHLYSFHAVSEEDPEVSDNLKLKEQMSGTYAGLTVPFGADPWSVVGNNDTVLQFPLGYTWLDDVKRVYNPGIGEFFVDWKIKDLWKQSRNGKQDIHLRMTMVNDWAADEIALANGMPPRTANNLKAIDHMEYMLVRRKGSDLNTLFTTVIEPYDTDRYIKSIENVPVTVSGGTPGKTDVAKAVKVELIDGRIDYIVYAQNNTVTYNVGDVFEFRGFVGVWSTDANGVNIYSYVNDGEMIGNDTVKIENLDAAIKGTITDFQREHSFDNWIDAEFDCEIADELINELSGRLINVEREALGNSTYVIESVNKLDSTHARINLGNITLISSFIDVKNQELGYNYDVAVGKSFDIPLSYEDNPAPVFDEVADNITTSAGSSVSVTVSATGDEGSTVTYQARTLPRGASFNEETGTFTWKPDSSQIGDNLVAIDAVDNYGRITTQYFTVTVYGSTTSKPSDKTEENTGSDGTSAGGGGGGAAPETPSTDDGNSSSGEENIGESGEMEENGENTTEPGSEKEDLRFIDLADHAWAADAINTLADEGIVKGTTVSTYSPAKNITRADFASLLVRAFELTSDDKTNFDDVAYSDYFAAELAIARNTGIVNGIGDNKYAPRNTITRQDMMTIVYRALTVLDVELVGRADPGAPEYEDFSDVADYAKDAVSALITSGLVNGKNGRIAPADYTTRAEVAVLLKRILDYMTK